MLKNNNKGYFLAETIIVLTVVALAITTLYVNSMESYVKEKNELTKYNTVDGLYSANAVKKYLYKYVNDFKVNANTNGYIDVNNYLNGQSIKVSNVTFFKELNVKQLYFSTYDMTKLISSGVLKKNIQKELSNIENDSKCVYRYIVIYNDYSYSLVGVGCGEEEEEIQTIAKFNYTGSEQTYTVPANGYYKVEAWGAQGGNSGGKGAYTYGEVYLKKGTNLYIQVGGQGSNNPAGVLQSVAGGYNGGGGTEGQNCCSRSFGTGGGATDIRLSGGAWNDDLSLKSRIMVAAGGGGRFTEGTEGGSAGAGGALNGLPGSGKNENYCVGLGGTQTSAGTISTTGENCDVTEDAGYTDPGKSFGGFGYGGKHGTDGNNSTGGGGGYYGGSSSGHIASAGGGSSYVSGYAGCVAIATSSSLTPKTGCTDGTTNIECSYHYSGTIFQNAKMIAGNDKMPNHEGTGTMTGNSGNGYAQISYCGIDQASCNSLKAEFNYTGSTQVYTVPTSGYYKMEAWGAQGGSVTENGEIPKAEGGKGAYTYGEIYLESGTNLYIQVGGQGSKSAASTAQDLSGGYNGGGGTKGQNCCSRSFGTGGGATDIRLSGGAWNDLSSLKSRIMVAAGGGGAFNGTNVGSWSNPGGYGGGLHGGDGSQGTFEAGQWCSGLGATQTSGGKITTDCEKSDNFNGEKTGSFGIGGGYSSTGEAVTGGGGGYYGGSKSGHIASAGGGSSFISGYKGCVAISSESSLTPKTGCTDGTTNIECSYHYSGKKFQNAKMIAGNDKMPNHEGTGTMTGNSGNGYVKISYCGTNQSSCKSN